MSKGRTVEFVFNPFEETGAPLPADADKGEVLEAAADFVKESILEYVAGQNSPVAGHGAFKSLSKDYAKRKKAEGGSPVPNLELSGDMLDALRVTVRGNRIRVSISGTEGAKADGHCNHSGDSELPLRRFIPDDGETFKKPILDGIRRIIKVGG